MISPTAEYALRAVVCLGSRAPEPQTNNQIAETTKVPNAYLSKVLQLLGRADLVNSQRGLGGGYTLTRDLDDISLFDVVNAVEPIRRIRSCPLDLAGHEASLCPLHSRLDEAMAVLEKMLKESTVGSLVRERRERGKDKSCPFPLPLGLGE